MEILNLVYTNTSLKTSDTKDTHTDNVHAYVNTVDTRNGTWTASKQKNIN